VKFKRIIISFFLLLTYTVGFAHQIIPHHQDNAGAKHFCEAESENHHENAVDNCLELICFSHTDHCDEGIYDLLVCLFNDVNHPEDDCDNELYTVAPNNEKGFDELSKVKIAAILISTFAEVNFTTSTPIFDQNIQVKYLSPFPSDTPLRGPPTL